MCPAPSEQYSKQGWLLKSIELTRNCTGRAELGTTTAREPEIARQPREAPTGRVTSRLLLLAAAVTVVVGVAWEVVMGVAGPAELHN